MHLSLRLAFARTDCTPMTHCVPMGLNPLGALLFGGDGGTRTLAPVSRPTPLAGAPLHQLEYISIVKLTNKIMNLFGTMLAERVGFEPTALSSHRFSRPAP